MKSDEVKLPHELLKRASLRGNEYAWHIVDIPKVIEAAREAGLVSIGGQLQFRLPNDGTCECYWVEVNTYKSVSKKLPWDARVIRAADVALSEFNRLQSKFNLVEEGRRAFREQLQRAEAQGIDVAETMCFVWYVIGA